MDVNLFECLRWMVCPTIIEHRFSRVSTFFYSQEEFIMLFDWWSSIDQNITAELKEGLFSALSSGPDLVTYEAFSDALNTSEVEAAATQ